MKLLNCSYLFFFLVLSFTGCNNGKRGQLEQESSTEATSVDVNIQDAKLFDIKDLASSVHYVSLETKDVCLIGEIKKIIQTEDGSFVIFDSKQNKIFLFDQNGRFITQLGAQGRGPSEYLYLNDICYDPQTKTVYAFERMKNSMFLFNLKGEVIEVIPSEFSFNSFIRSEFGFWIYSCFAKNNPNYENLMLVDHNLQKQIKGYFPQKDFIGSTMESFFREGPQGISYFISPFGNTIYRLGSQAIPVMTINFKDQTFPFDKITESTTKEEFETFQNTNNSVGNISNILFTNKYTLFNCSETALNKPVKYFTVKVDGEETHKSQVYNAYMNSFGDLGVNLSKIHGVTSNNELICTITPNSIDMYALEKVKNTISEDISGESNPIIALFKLK